MDPSPESGVNYDQQKPVCVTFESVFEAIMDFQTLKPVSIHSMMTAREEPTASTVIPLFCPVKGSRISMVQNDQNEGGFSNSLERATVRVYSGTDTSVQHQLQCSIMTL